MEDIILLLKSSSDNETRKRATEKLLTLQEEQPDEFLSFTWIGISSNSAADHRFFLSTVLLSFVEDSWRSVVSTAKKEALLSQYTMLVVSERGLDERVCRKLGTTIGCMAKQGPKAREPGELPSHIQYVADAYMAALTQLTSSPAEMSEPDISHASQLLFLLHLLLKEIQTRRIGNIFEKLCHRVSTALAQVLLLAPFSSVASETEWKFALRGLKCAYRVFGSGVFDRQFCFFMLQESWKLAGNLVRGGPLEAPRYLRLMDYAVKALQKVVVYFPSRLSELGTDFFIPTSVDLVGTHADTSLLHFLCSIITASRETGSRATISEKAACRAMSILSVSFTAEDADDFIAEFLSFFTSSSLLPSMMEAIIVSFLADECSEIVQQMWSKTPERGLEDLYIEYDNEDSSASCAEQLFLAMTGSSHNASVCLSAAWEIVHRVLETGSEQDVTAALHAIGIGYYTMSAESGYLNFLNGKLLPPLHTCIEALRRNEAAPMSEFTLRRVVWLIGMWCESVPDVPTRQVVHQTLSALLRANCSPMIALIVLRAVENFVSDNNFTLEELPGDVLEVILGVLEQVLPQLDSPLVLNQMIGLLYVLMEKGAVPSQGDVVIALLMPLAQRFIEKFQAAIESRDFDNDVDDSNPSLLTIVLECLSSGVSMASEKVWDVYPLVLVSTEPEGHLAPYIEEEGWELLLQTARTSLTYENVSEEALKWCFHNMHRDFAALPTVFQCAATLLLCRTDSIDGLITEEQVDCWLQLHRDTPKQEVARAVVGFLLVVMKHSSWSFRGFIAQKSWIFFCQWSGDVQEAVQPLHLTFLLFVGLQDPSIVEVLLASLASSLEAPRPEGSPSITENLLFLLDVSPNPLYDKALHCILRALVSQCKVDPADSAAAQHALESVDVVLETAEGAESPEERNTNALLDVTCNSELSLDSPYFSRLSAAFGGLLL